ncbi:uncharacterized protein [Argopecten irradians]|uniref:uncharacterized protein n=1 Tax=Argopecten irradians TaxID=31199 RepID=UPI00371BE53C
MALPFVPSDEVENCFNMIRVPEGENEKMENYVDTNWIHSQTFPIQTWNVFGVTTRTNNDCEGWHRRLSHAAKDTARPFYVLVPLLHEEAKKLPLQKQMVEEGALTRLQRSATRQFQGKIFRLWSKYEAEIITCLELLNTIRTGYTVRHFLSKLGMYLDVTTRTNNDCEGWLPSTEPRSKGHSTTVLCLGALAA